MYKSRDRWQQLVNKKYNPLYSKYTNGCVYVRENRRTAMIDTTWDTHIRESVKDS